MISLIACMSKNYVIGNDNRLIWHLPEDLKHFKTITSGHAVVMGRKTYESIGKPLVDRKNYILTKNTDYKASGCIIVNSIRDVIDLNEKIFIIGGSEIYNLFLPFANKIYLTIINENFVGDTYFPKFNLDEWELINSRVGEENEPLEYIFNLYERK